MANLITIKTPKCPMCGKSAEFTVTAEGYNNYVNGGLVQRCFPELKAEDRERLITGICPECWDRIFN